MLFRLMLAALAVVACKSGDHRAERIQSRPAPTPVPAQPAAQRPPADLDYVEVVTGGAARDAELPLLIAIHGLGDRPESFAGLFQGVPLALRIALLRGPTAWGEGFAWFDLSRGDLEASAAGIRAAAERVASAVTRISRERPTRGRPVITGFSQGGALSFALAAQHPDLIEAALPVGGWLPRALHPPPSNDASARSLPRVVALHGSLDPLIVAAAATSAIAAMQRAGHDAKLELFPDVEHNVPMHVRARLHALITAFCQQAR